MSRIPPPSLREYLARVPAGNHVVAYLTLGDPHARFVEVVDEVLAAGALTLELGLPHSKPLEGPTLLASHQRALVAGIDTTRAVELLESIADRHRDRPLVVVVQGMTLADETMGNNLLDSLAVAGAAAVLPVGVAQWQLPALALRIQQRGLETVIACPSDVSPKLRDLTLRYCSGCLYVPRGRVTGTDQAGVDVGEFCRGVARETDLPMIVGVGVETAADVAAICATPAKAAAVGSALVAHIHGGSSAGEFIRRLIGR